MPKTHKSGRDAGNGQFIPVKEAQRRGDKAVVETIKNPIRPPLRPFLR